MWLVNIWSSDSSDYVLIGQYLITWCSCWAVIGQYWRITTLAFSRDMASLLHYWTVSLLCNVQLSHTLINLRIFVKKREWKFFSWNQQQDTDDDNILFLIEDCVDHEDEDVSDDDVGDDEDDDGEQWSVPGDAGPDSLLWWWEEWGDQSHRSWAGVCWSHLDSRQTWPTQHCQQRFHRWEQDHEV